MLIGELSEVAVPRVDLEAELDERPVFCMECGLHNDAVWLGKNGFQCPGCRSFICVMCGCAEQRACIGGCHWLTPGICSSHKQELHELAVKVFGGLR